MTTWAIIAGGPSLKTFDVSRLKKFPCIAVNNAYEIAPWARILFFGDAGWWKWYGAQVKSEFDGEVVGMAVNDVPDEYRNFKPSDKPEQGLEPEYLYGVDSGTKAINLAFHRGAKRILVAGCDFSAGPKNECHWHAGHPTPTNRQNWQRIFAPKQEELAKVLTARGVEVFRVTEPGVEAIPYRPDVLCEG